MYTHVLCPLDGSELAERALPHAVAQAKAFGARLTLLRVVEVPLVPVMPEGITVDIDLLPHLREDARQYIATQVAALREQVSELHGEVMEGRAAETIADFAVDRGVDLIVMATHGRSGLSRLAFGSVADRVLRLAHCPVLLVRANP